MRILNATSGTVNIPMGESSIVILPGKVNKEALVASQDLIQKVISLGTAEQFGIISEGSFDTQMIERVPGAYEYCYANVDQAIAKLIDPDKDYNAMVESDVTSMKYKATIANLEKDLKKKTREIEKLKADYAEELQKRTSDIESVKIINTKEEEINSLKTKITLLENQSQETRNSLVSMEKENVDFRKTIGDNDQLIKNLTAKNNKLTEDNKKLKESLEKLIAEVEKNKVKEGGK